MSSKAMMKVVDTIMEEALPPMETIGLPGVLESAVEERKTLVKQDDYVFRHIWDGVMYLERLLKTRHIWLPQWKLAKKLGKRVRFLSVSMFVDDFVKQMNSKVKLTCMQSTLGNICIYVFVKKIYILIRMFLKNPSLCRDLMSRCLHSHFIQYIMCKLIEIEVEAERGGAKLEELSTVIQMLAEAEGCIAKGDSPYFNVFTDEVVDFGKGKFVEIDGEEVLYIVHVSQITADSPASKRSVDLSTSTSFVKVFFKLCFHRGATKNFTKFSLTGPLSILSSPQQLLALLRHSQRGYID
jgi:hypothetical protein